MRWLIIQSAGMHDGVRDNWTPNHYLRECFAVKHGLEKNGEVVDVWGLRHPNFKNKIDFNSYDRILCIENYEIGWMPNLAKIKKPLKLQWCIDLHCGGRSRLEQITPNVDIVLHSTKSLIPGYKSKFPKQKHIWFPNAVDDRYFIPRNLSKVEDVVFVAHPRNRGNWIEPLKKDIGLKHYFETGIDMLNRVAKAKVHFNVSISCDVNYRCFETIGLGTILLTNYIPEMEKLGFKDNVNCRTYTSYADCVQKYMEIKALKEEGYSRIIQEAQTLAKRHSYTNRIKELLSQINR